MTNEIIQQNLERLNNDQVVQNLIAQSNARYILLNTSEDKANYPPYTIQDENLNVLAFHYLNLGCCYAENQLLSEAIAPLEKGASILESVHAVQGNRKATSNYYGIIASMSYYVSFQYSKAFILITKFEANTVIGRLIRTFLQRNFRQLNEVIYTVLLNESYSDASVAANFEEGNQKIYEYVVAKALDGFVKYYLSGNNQILERSRQILNNAKDIAAMENDPGIWWVIRLLLLIADGFNEASLWNALSGYFDLVQDQVDNYIKSLVYMEPRGIYELFVTQRKSLPKVLNLTQAGCVVSIPTSSGKTRIAEIAILYCIQQNPYHKILYIAPFRSLAFEVEAGLGKVFEHSNIKVSHLYGGSLYSKLDEMAIEDSQVIIATPEKAKAILRGKSAVISQLGLAIIDEGHLLGDNKRMVMNEIFYEELRYYFQENGGRFLLLSAVLPNAEDIAEWFTDSRDTVYRENWRPSNERLGILEWNNRQVNLNWESQDTERASFNRRFIVAEVLPRVKYQRRDTIKYFPGDKNEAVAATAYKLRTFGPVLIFVGQRPSVFVMADAYLKALGNDPQDFIWGNASDWRSYELACIEAYGDNNPWLQYARKGILCHNADLHGDVRLPLERLMRANKPLVIIATSTLGQGVNLGISTVIFSTLHQAGSPITARDFWNIAGRAGRAYVDHEGKILVALETNGLNNRKREAEVNWVKTYFDKEKIDLAQSGILSRIKELKIVAEKSGTDFDLLLQLITENRVDEVGNDATKIENTLDWIDDTLLSLLLVHNPQGELDISWVERFFIRSLAAIQAANAEEISRAEVIAFLKARIKGIAKKVGEDRTKWRSIVQSGIALNSDLLLEEKMAQIIQLVRFHIDLIGDTLETKTLLLRDIENIIGHLPVLTEEGNYLAFDDIDTIRRQWLAATPISTIQHLRNSLHVISKIYTFSLPWVLNGIAKKMRTLDLEEEAAVMEDLAVLVEFGLPSIEKVKIYQAGIRSRSAANELGNLFGDDAPERNITDYKRELINNSGNYIGRVSVATAEWLGLLERYATKTLKRVKRLETFTFGETHEKTNVLIAKMIGGKKYLISPDLTFVYKGWGDIDFSSVCDLSGIEFQYSIPNANWVMKNSNPYIQVTQ